MNRKFKVTWRTLRIIEHSLMVHARVLEAYINFILMYMVDHILLVLPIKYLIKDDGETTTPFKLVTGTKPSIYNLRVLFCPCVERKATAHVGTKALNIRHQAKKCFRGIIVGIPHHQKWYLGYVSHKHKIISSYNVVFDERLYCVLAHMSQPYSEAVAMLPAVSYIPYDTS